MPAFSVFRRKRSQTKLPARTSTLPPLPLASSGATKPLNDPVTPSAATPRAQTLPTLTPLSSADLSSPASPLPENTGNARSSKPVITPRGLDLLGRDGSFMSPKLLEAEAAVAKAEHEHKSASASQLPDNVEDKVEVLEDTAHAIWSSASPVETTLEAGAMQVIEDGLHKFEEGIPLLMNALDEIGRLHPCIGAVVLAFKTVYTLEMTRHENDKKIKALYVEMGNMMRVLLQLKDVKDVGAMENRIKELSDATADDIKACGNACDAYSKKKLIFKLLYSPLWEQRLVSFVGTFATRRGEFEFALAIHTAVGVDVADQKIGEIELTSRDIQQKMNIMLSVFQRFLPPDHSELKCLIEQACGSTGRPIKQQQQQLGELLKDKPVLMEADTHVGPQNLMKLNDVGKTSIEETLAELKDTPEGTQADEARNLEWFQRKFEIKQSQIAEDIKQVVKRESDRVISAVVGGPHDRIVDKDIHAIWQDMGWKGNVKARHFILALRDYYHEKAEAQKHAQTYVGTVDPDPDEWTLPYINVPYLQPILEAFDDDASGFITISEVNKFTTARPLDWSLPRWIAYWAVGWNMTMTSERDKIIKLLDTMIALLPQVLPANRAFADEYLYIVWKNVYQTVISLNERPAPDALQTKFRPFVEAEERRLRTILEGIRYDIDELDALTLVTGPGRIEKSLFPLIRLLLERHLDIFQLCRTVPVSRQELYDAATTVCWVIIAIGYRFHDLQIIFTNQHLDLQQQFNSFSWGLFKYYHEPSALWAASTVQELKPAVVSLKDLQVKTEIDPTIVLNYPVDEGKLDYPAYEELDDSRRSDISSQSNPMLGTWNRLQYSGSDAQYVEASMGRYTITHASSDDAAAYGFQGYGISSDASTFDISGSCASVSDEVFSVRFQLFFDGSSEASSYFQGQLDVSAASVSGFFGGDEDASSHTKILILKRTPERILRFRPSPAVLSQNKALALWSFALSAVRDQIRRRSWSWAFFRDRRDHRRLYFQLSDRDSGYGGALSEHEGAELQRCIQLLTHSDARFYSALYTRVTSRRAVHSDFRCDFCWAALRTSRVTCLDCVPAEGVRQSVDLCDSPSCIAAPENSAAVNSRDRAHLSVPHVPTHDVMKVRRTLHLWDIPRMQAAAKSAILRARENVMVVAKDEYSRSETLTADSEDKPTKSLPGCIICHKPVTLPCWYCVECPDPFFICIKCDETGGWSIGKHHEHTHALVRCCDTADENDGPSMEQNIATLQESMQAMNERQLQLEDYIRAMNERQVVLEGLLRTFLADSQVPSP